MKNGSGKRTWNRKATKTRMSQAPDVNGETAVAGHRVLVGALQGDGGFGSSTRFAAEDHRLPEGTHDVGERHQELRSH